MKEIFLRAFNNLKEDEKLSIQLTNGHGFVLNKDADVAVINSGDGFLVTIMTQEDIFIEMPFTSICYWLITK